MTVCPFRSGGTTASAAVIDIHTVHQLAHVDLARLGFLALVQRDGQDAVVQLGVDGLLIDGRREREAPQDPL